MPAHPRRCPTRVSVPLLSTLSDVELEELATALNTVRFAEGDHVIKQGDEGSTFYVVRGRARERAGTRARRHTHLPTTRTRTDEGG